MQVADFSNPYMQRVPLLMLFFFLASVTPGLCDNAIKLELKKISYLLSVRGGDGGGERGRTGPKQEMSALVLRSW